MRRIFPLIDDLSNSNVDVFELVKNQEGGQSKKAEKEISLENIKMLISKDKLREAIDQMADYMEIEQSDNKDEIIVIQSRYSRLTRKERLQIISNQELNTGKSKIVSDLLEIIEEQKLR